MRARIPIYVEERLGRFRARPLFHDEPVVEHERLNRALDRLGRALIEALERRLAAPRHQEAARLLHAPRFSTERAKLSIEVRRRTIQADFLLVALPAPFGRVAFTPSVPALWFTVGRGEEVEARALAALTEHFRKLEREDDPDLAEAVEEVAIARKPFATDLELEVDLPVLAPTAAPEGGLAELLGGGPVEGAVELARTCRSLDALYPDALGRAALRDREVGELTRLLGFDDGAAGAPAVAASAAAAGVGSGDAAGPPPVLLLGPSGVGKTALVHELCRRTIDRRGGRFGAAERMWLASPMRLISGMMYVGQWESRVHAILAECEAKRHLLVIEDVLGLYDAGVSASSQLAVAHVLRPWLERRRVRLVAAMTEEAFRVLREVDRGMADLFSVLRLGVPSEAEALRMGIHVARDLEARHGCRFAPEVVPLAADLARRYLAERSSPGSLCDLIQPLAARMPGQDLGEDDLLSAFEDRTGMTVGFLGQESGFTVEEVEHSLARQVLGQRDAVRAAAEVVAIARARLGDPERPLGSLLFTGPTGVGKTQLAKALARCLFGDPARLVRIDMNEHLEADAVTRLIGSFRDPEGQLTAAIRRQPFSVVLFDEVEKAHPDVLDLLLQLLGHGRLTDARGRTACFRGALVVLTSNLGAREAEAHLGLGARTEEARAEAYVAAAERFFRPELLNRIDRIVPFRGLGRADVAALAALEAERLFAREGLARRRCALEVHPEAVARVAVQGFHPDLGARALKRAVERVLMRPLAARLAAVEPSAPAVVELLPGRGDGVEVAMTPLAPVEAAPPPITRAPLDRPLDALAGLREALARMESELPPLCLDGSGLEPAALHALDLRERVRQLGERVEHLDERLREPQAGLPRRPLHRPAGGRTLARLPQLDDAGGRAAAFAALLAAEDPRAAARGLGAALGEAPEHGEAEVVRERLTALCWESAYLDALAACPPERLGERVVLWIRPLGPWPVRLDRLCDDLTELCRGGFELHVAALADAWRPGPAGSAGLAGAAAAAGAEAPPPGPASAEAALPADFQGRALAVEGPLAGLLGAAMQGVHLFLEGGGAFRLAQVLALPLAPGERPAEALAALIARRRSVQAAGEGYGGSAGDDPIPVGAVVRIETPEDANNLDWRRWSKREQARGSGDGEALWRASEPWRGDLVDLRSGLVLSPRRSRDDERLAVLARLPLPAELVFA